REGIHGRLRGMSKPIVELADVHKWYGDLHVLKGVDLSVERGEVVVLCGVSGSGKSTLIRCINGLEPFQKGTILVDGVSLQDKGTNLDLIRREVGMVFQQFNLFP